MTTIRFALAAGMLAVSVPALAADPAPAAAPAAPAAKYSTAATDIGTLIDNPATKAVLDRNLPGFSDNPQLAMARAMTMRQIQQFAPDALTDEKLAKVDAELAELKD
jgi:para-nitrobenzyl esterase